MARRRYRAARRGCVDVRAGEKFGTSEINNCG